MNKSKFTRRSLLSGVLASATCFNLAWAEDLEITGTWTGALEAGSSLLHVKFEITTGGSVTLYSLDQDNKPIYGKAKSMLPERIEFEFKSIKAGFHGRAVDANHIEGTWTQGSDIALVLLRGDAGLTARAKPVEPLTQQGLDLLRRECNAPALTAGSAKRGKQNQKWVTGERGVNTHTAATTEDQWHLGSITKSMTATLIARLAESGAISWDDTVGNILNEIVPDMLPSYTAVNFRHLLSHRSGLPGDIPVAALMEFMLIDNTEIPAQRQHYARVALTMSPLGPKESTYTYANNGYIVAAAMLEAKCNRSWEDLIRTHVFEPLRLNSAGFGAPGSFSVGKLSQPIGHTADIDAQLLRLVGGRGIRGVRPGYDDRTDNPAVLGPAGRVHMNIDDVLSYLAAHRDRSNFLNNDSWQMLHTPPFGGNYAMGWIVRPDGTLWHNGSNNMWYAEVLLNRDSGIAAAAVANESRPAAMNAVGRLLLRAASTGDAS